MTTETELGSQTDRPKIQTVLAARPGVIREALRATLAVFPQFETCGVAGGGLSALDLVRQYKPALIILDSGLLEDEITKLLRQIKQEQPQIQCLVVASTHRTAETLLAGGADTVVLRSEPGRLVEVLSKMVIL